MTTKFTRYLKQQLTLNRSWIIVRQIISRQMFLAVIASLFINIIFHCHLSAQHITKDSLGDAYFFHKNDFPSRGTPAWVGKGEDTQGITHDDNNWYISMNQSIWRIPLSVNLNQSDFTGQAGVLHVPLDSKLKAHYNHIGDIDHYNHKGIDYLLLPLTGDGDDRYTAKDSIDIYGIHHQIVTLVYKTPSAIAIYRASDLKYIAYDTFPNFKPNTHQKDAGWCAVTPSGKVVSSDDNTNKLNFYKIDWNNVVSKKKLKLTWGNSALLTLANGADKLHNMQGGEFTEMGDRLYVSCGILKCADWTPFGGGEKWPTDGLHVFDTLTWKEIQRSTNGTGCFNYSFTNDCDGDEPEGLTIWDLDSRRVYGASGQLHVILFNHAILNPFDDDVVSLKHYTSFKKPDDITVYATRVDGEPANDPIIAAFLNQKNPSPNCADITYIPHLSIFPPGKTPVTFTITDHATVKVQCTANVNVINKQDECLIATRIYACDKIVVDNYAATHSVPAPIFPCNGGSAKDVWFKITPPSPVFSVETYQVAGGLTDLDMQAFSGTCGHLQEIACDDSSGDDKHAKIIFQNLPNSNSIYIRITDHDGTHFGKFGIYARKIEIGANIFNATQFVSGDGPHVFDNPTLIGDVNGDGKADLIFLYRNTTLGTIVRTKISNGDGTYSPYEQTLGDGPSAFKNPTLIGDVNGDGKADLIFIYYNIVQGTVVRTKISNGNGTYTPYETVLGDGPQVFAHPALIGDVNGDGKADLVFVYYNTAVGTIVRTKISNGNGTYTPYETALGDGPHVFARPTIIADVNGDKKADLIFLYYDQTKGTIVRTKISNGDGTYKPYEQTLGDGPHVFTYPTLIGDVNGDGKADLVFIYYNTTNGTTVRTKLSNGDGTYSGYEATTGDGSGVFTYPTLTGDVNGDGKTDLIFVGQNWKSCGLNIRVKMSNGDGTWCQGWQGMPDGGDVHNYPTLTGDVNGDGRTDLVFTFSNDTSGLTIRTKIAQNYSLCTTGNSITNPQQQDDPIKIYPNPTTGIFSIATKIQGEIEVEILDMNGRQMRPKERFIGTRQFDLSSLPNGIYLVKIYYIRYGNMISKKILKMR